MQCHDLTFINTLSKTYAFLNECSHVMLMSRALTHAHVMYEKPSFPKQNIFVLYFNSLDNLRKTALFKSHVSFVGNELFGVTTHASYTFRHFRGLSSLDTYVWPRIQAFHLRGCLSLLTTTRHIISNRATLGRRPFYRAHHLNTKHSVLSCHALTSISRDVPVHMQCRMSLLVLSCYMHDESYMQHL